ncbi:hypothetical protein E2C01_101963 [Portunus trituberculatus]|uniref:Uncharacterized protein n=1 Tax=Portunus trituberculatus TaxID=210409 RepID=A0A5B7KB66_PORTR|nr:hypothetical protein [Portunus trituberculatus]
MDLLTQTEGEEEEEGKEEEKEEEEEELTVMERVRKSRGNQKRRGESYLRTHTAKQGDVGKTGCQVREK